MGADEVALEAEGGGLEDAEGEEPYLDSTGASVGPADGKASRDQDVGNHFADRLRTGVHAGADKNEGGEEAENAGEKEGRRCEGHRVPGERVLFPIGHGVRVRVSQKFGRRLILCACREARGFGVDNPHSKPKQSMRRDFFEGKKAPYYLLLRSCAPG